MFKLTQESTKVEFSLLCRPLCVLNKERGRRIKYAPQRNVHAAVGFDPHVLIRSRDLFPLTCETPASLSHRASSHMHLLKFKFPIAD